MCKTHFHFIHKEHDMKKSLFILLLTIVMALSLTAHAEFTLPGSVTAIDANAFEGDAALKGRMVLPASVKTIGSGAFAGTGLHALVVPAGATHVSGTVLLGTEAAYLHLKGKNTAIQGSLSDVAYVFGPAFGSASSLSNFYAEETLVTSGGFYYSVTEGAAIPLCAVNGASISGEITVPKLVDGQPVRSLDTLIVNGCDDLSGILVPAYLSSPSHLEVSTYQTMTAEAPVPSVSRADVGDTVTWTTSSTGAYGDITYTWTFDTDGTTATILTAEPTVDYTFTKSGSCTVSVTISDEVNDSASATAAAFPISSYEPVYRALLVGNTYAGTAQEMPGSANDVAGMRTMLSRMSGTPYRITTRSELSADDMITAIRNTFSGAQPKDVSLFYFSGHGANAIGTSYHGSLMGTGTTYLSVAQLKTVLDEIPGKKVVIIDSCHSGQMIGRSGEASAVTTAELSAFNRKVVSTFSQQPRGDYDLANSGYYVITAAHSTEDRATMGYDADSDGILDKRFGLFTYSMCYGNGWNMATNASRTLTADSDGDGVITLNEAYSYARYKAQQSNPNQTAQVYPANSSMVVWAK